MKLPLMFKGLVMVMAVFSAGVISAHVETINAEVTDNQLPAAQTAQAEDKQDDKPTDNKPPDSKPPAPKLVVVQAGDSLSMIGKTHGVTHLRLFDANPQVKDANLIYEGDIIRIPRPDEKLATRVAPKPPAPTTATAPKPTVRTVSTAGTNNIDGGVWDRLAACESGGNWAINTGNGYYGGVQFSLPTWQSVGGTGYPHQNSKAEQIKRAQILQARSSWGQWPECSIKLGLR